MSPSLCQAGLAHKARGTQTPQVGVEAGLFSQKVCVVAFQTSAPQAACRAGGGVVAENPVSALQQLSMCVAHIKHYCIVL